MQHTAYKLNEENLDPANEPIRRYLYKVRDLVTPRLSDVNGRIRAGLVPLYWGPFDGLSYNQTPRKYLESFFMKMSGNYPNGESLYWGDTKAPCWVALYTEGIAHNMRYSPENIPFGRALAFTLTHELAHIACGCSGKQHDDPRWVQGCKEMGIKEEAYTLKGFDWVYDMGFTDEALWLQIRDLPNYPGDAYPQC